jgi:hypothetical protein
MFMKEYAILAIRQEKFGVLDGINWVTTNDLIEDIQRWKTHSSLVFRILSIPFFFI